ncbi:hypothetical protein SDC9_142465 [bioreactor metagenome]|uniref:Uncharacterized protein n=1 Tax=bioreactor metagenome TaxID=1076179 RepID=A0A645E189_9ZZZZ
MAERRKVLGNPCAARGFVQHDVARFRVVNAAVDHNAGNAAVAECAQAGKQPPADLRGKLHLRELKNHAGGILCEYLFELGAKIRRVGIRVAD